jgi:hypothetical protein
VLKIDKFGKFPYLSLLLFLHIPHLQLGGGGGGGGDIHVIIPFTYSSSHFTINQRVFPKLNYVAFDSKSIDIYWHDSNMKKKRAF